MTLPNDAVLRHYAGAFEARALRERAGWLAGVQQEASERFLELGFPTTRMEEWRYTNVAPVARTPYAIPEAPGHVAAAALDAHLPDLGGDRFVFVDGFYVGDLSRRRTSSTELVFERLAEVGPLAAPARAAVGFGQLADGKDDAFTALNTALASDGALLRVEDGCSIEHPIHLVFVASEAGAPARAACPRLLLRAGAGSTARIVVDHPSLGASADRDALTNAVTELFIERDASLEVLLAQREGPATWHIATQTAQVASGGRLVFHTLNLGGALVRNDLAVRLIEEGGECELQGLYLAGGRQVVDNHTLVDHAVPSCRSSELYKGIAAERGRGVFRGRVLVRPDAQKTDASQRNRSLLLSRDAEIDAKPQLEIYADDVKCSHGSSIGQLDPEALFFLRARGLSERAARGLLIEGFAREIAEAPRHDLMREFALQQARERLDTLLTGGTAR